VTGAELEEYCLCWSIAAVLCEIETPPKTDERRPSRRRRREGERVNVQDNLAISANTSALLDIFDDLDVARRREEENRN